MPKKKQTRPNTPPVAVRFTEEQNQRIAAVAEEFQISKQDVIRLSVAAGLKAMQKIGLIGLQEFLAAEIEKKKIHEKKTPASKVAAPGMVKLPRKKAAIMAAAGTEAGAIECEVGDWDMKNGIAPVRICGRSMEPVFHDEDVVTCHHKAWARSPYMKKGLIYLVHYNGGFLIKRYNTRKPKPDEAEADYLTNTGKVGVLESLNPKFPRIDITGPFEWQGWFDE